MERLFYIKFYDKDGKFMAREDYSGLQFADVEIAEKYIQSEKKIMEEALDCPLKLNPHHKEVPTFSIKDLVNAYCEASGYNYDQIIGKGRKRDYVNVRMFITKTALDLGFVHGQLRPFFPDGLSYHYEKTINDLIESGSLTIQIWKAHEAKVMESIGALCSDDGSGEPVKD
jgi:hypothetical protein